jgi:hypothetical protein
MPLFLSQEKQNDVFNKIKKIFSDFSYFDLLLSNGIKQLISDVTFDEINMEFIDSLNETYIKDMRIYQTKDQLAILEKMKIILMTTVVYLFSLSPSAHSFLLHSTEDLLSLYPQFKEQLSLTCKSDIQELEYLIQFRNYMKLALLLLPARNNKIFLLRVVERLEGSSIEYITGTGQRLAVTRRATDIFHQESGLPMVKKTSTKRTRAAEQQLLQQQQGNQEMVIQEVPVLKKFKTVSGTSSSKANNKKQLLKASKSLPLPLSPLSSSSSLDGSLLSPSVVAMRPSPAVLPPSKLKFQPSDLKIGNIQISFPSSPTAANDLPYDFENVDSLLLMTNCNSHPNNYNDDGELIPLSELELDETAYSTLLAEEYCESFTETLRQSGF